MKKAVIIARVSTSRQEQEGLSLHEMQVPRLEKYAKENNIEIVKRFVFSESAAQKIRKKFNGMISYIKSNKNIDVILAIKVDRVTRNYRDAVIINDLITERSLELHLVQERLVIHKKSKPHERMQWDMQVLFAKQQINVLSEHGRNTRITKLENGEIPGKAPYGYKNVKIDQKSKGVEIDPFKAEVVKFIFDQYTFKRNSMDTIRLKLKSEFGVKLPKSSIGNILSRTFYYGEIEEEGNLYPHKYETLISKETFKLTQARRSGQNKQRVVSTRLPIPYRGLFRCKVCGCMYTGEEKRKKLKNGDINKHLYYHCTGGRGKHKHKYLSQAKADEQLSKLFKNLTIPKEQAEFVSNELQTGYEANAQRNKVLASQYKQEHNKYSLRLERAYDDKVDGSITTEEFEKRSKRYKEQISFYENKISHLVTGYKQVEISSNYILDVASRAEELFLSSKVEQKKALLDLVLSNPTVDDATIEFNLKKPFDSILLCNERKEWLLGLGSNQRQSD